MSQSVRFADRLSAGLFDLFMVPLEVLRLRRIRRRLLSRARGVVLELGAGTGVNARHYSPQQVDQLTVSDRDRRESVLRERYRPAAESGVSLSVDRIDAERLPAADNSCDTVVATLLFCSVGCPACGFEEIRRVLRPDGRYLFLEHVRPTHRRMARFFDRINPLWNQLSRGCNLNRTTLATLEAAGFQLTQMEQDRRGVLVWGEARPRP